MSTKFQYISRLPLAVQFLSQSHIQSSLTSDETLQWKTLSDYLQQHQNTHLTLSHIQILSKLLRSHDFLINQGNPSFSALQSGYLHELLYQANLYIPPPVKKQRDPEFLAFLQRMKIKQEQLQYAELVQDLPGNKNLKHNIINNINPNNSKNNQQSTIGSEYASAQRDIGIGVNIITLMFTGFVVFYYAGTGLFPESKIYPIVFGLVGLIGAMLLEISLFLVREKKTNMRKEKAEKSQLEREKNILLLEEKRRNLAIAEKVKQAHKIWEEQKEENNNSDNNNTTKKAIENSENESESSNENTSNGANIRANKKKSQHKIPVDTSTANSDAANEKKTS